MPTFKLIIFCKLFFVFYLTRQMDACACMPKKQMYAFSSVQKADVLCRVKYIHQYKGAFALVDGDIKPKDYQSVYPDNPEMLKIADTCFETIQGDSFSLAWYCAEYCLKFCPKASAVNCTYKALPTTCRTAMHCECLNTEGQKCNHEIFPHMLQEKFNQSCLNCYWSNRGDSERICLQKFSDVLADANKCIVKPVDPNNKILNVKTVAVTVRSAALPTLNDTN